MTLADAIVAVLREHGELYGVPLRYLVADLVKREVSVGSLYVACDQLEEEGRVVSREGEATSERGWRPRHYWKLP